MPPAPSPSQSPNHDLANKSRHGLVGAQHAAPQLARPYEIYLDLFFLAPFRRRLTLPATRQQFERFVTLTNWLSLVNYPS
jgi:hypothetical protein